MSKEGYLVGAGYDGEKHLAFLKFYDPKKQEIFIWDDNTSHKPYCFSKDSIQSLKKIVSKDRIKKFRKKKCQTKKNFLKQ